MSLPKAPRDDSYPPISDYALIGDCSSAALISSAGSVDWCCFPQFDSRPVFGRLLDRTSGGHFTIRPAATFRSSRIYLPGTNVLETRFETDGGVLVLTDCMPIEEGVRPYHQLIRVARCLEGEVEVVVEFEPRFEYGLTVPQVTGVGPGLATAAGGPDALLIQSEIPLATDQTDCCRGGRTLKAGEEAITVVTYARPHELEVVALARDEIKRRLEHTSRYWAAWSDKCTYQGPYRQHVVRSALVLKALTSSETGAIVAAPTTSLPEHVGGCRNWDYRYAWLRDSSFTLYALFTLGYREEASAFMAWLQRTTAGHAEDLQVLYGVGGERFLPEVELPWVDGYRRSKPVRIGNDAARQFQLDIHGEVLDTAWLFHRHGGPISPEFWSFLSRLADFVVDCWRKPDEGIWEVRGGRRDFVYSKVMAWVALDRALKLAAGLDVPAPLQRWRRERDAIREAIDANGVDASGAFVQSFGSTEMDAANLLIPLVHYVRDTDPRVRATVEKTEQDLAVNGLLRRYRDGDGIRDSESTFTVCSFWLVDNLAAMGEMERATRLFEQLLTTANDVGLMAEELDAATGEQLGNYPQALSHLGLINSAIQLRKGAGASAGIKAAGRSLRPAS